MFLKLVLVAVWTCGVLTQDYHCSKRSALLLLKRPAYDFSIKLLQRVTDETEAHFVYSPISTWLQLIALSEGAGGRTFGEIWNVTKHHRNRCFKKKLGKIIYDLNVQLQHECKRESVFAIDSLMGVRKRFLFDVQKLYGIKVMLLNFDDSMGSAQEVNTAIGRGTGGLIDTAVYYDDFMTTSSLLMSDASYFKSEWLSPFDTALTKVQPFYSVTRGVKTKLGEVNMMNQVAYCNITDFPRINARVLELPFADNRISMLVFLPIRESWVGEIFYKLKKTRLTSIFNMYKRQAARLLNVSLPKFKIRSEVDNLAELIYDMGVKSIFYPDSAELRGISKYKMFASLITQISDIEVTEKGVTASVSVENLVDKDDAEEFVVDKPFVYIIVDRVTEFILYAGIYSKPSVF